MSAINERSNPPLVISNDQDVEKWKETWDGVSPIPDEIHQYMLSLWDKHIAGLQELIDIGLRGKV